ncbi:MAG: SDR family oxidoreductase [Verrucomicrobia bacterium]|nr:SDR family oxidoreductase [Verrucomicrobiota bacterium]
MVSLPVPAETEQTSAKRLAGKIAIVTGGSRGIGSAVAKTLANRGAAVMIAARDVAALDRVAGEIREGGGAAGTCALDLREGPSAAKLVEATVHAFGGLDILVNNAGATRRAPFLELTEADWTDGFALKFFGAVRLIRHAWPHLKQRSGSVVNVAGIGGRTPGAAFGLGGSVNAALLSLTKALADLGVQDQVQVNAINPGAIRTDRLNVRLQAIAREHHLSMEEAARKMVKEAGTMRLGLPEDVAYLVAFLVSSEGRFVHGALIDVDGGETKTM